ncbi:50S ribosomal protein L21 [Candidatus Daviesbacteria bacterium]|nr:50S ribosomal protein L21 [Candidatus Daviesbacteria bacterium]
MIDYAVCEIAGKQYKVVPGQPLTIVGKLSAKVLLLSENGKIKVGHPYLKENLSFKSLGEIKGEKIRVAKFRAKANYRRIKGYRSKLTQVVWDVKNPT